MTGWEWTAYYVTATPFAWSLAHELPLERPRPRWLREGEAFALNVSCPVCHAPARTPCFITTGVVRFISSAHMMRLDAAIEAAGVERVSPSETRCRCRATKMDPGQLVTSDTEHGIYECKGRRRGRAKGKRRAASRVVRRRAAGAGVL